MSTGRSMGGDNYRGGDEGGGVGLRGGVLPEFEVLEMLPSVESTYAGAAYGRIKFAQGRSM